MPVAITTVVRLWVIQVRWKMPHRKLSLSCFTDMKAATAAARIASPSISIVSPRQPMTYSMPK